MVPFWTMIYVSMVIGAGSSLFVFILFADEFQFVLHMPTGERIVYGTLFGLIVACITMLALILLKIILWGIAIGLAAAFVLMVLWIIFRRNETYVDDEYGFEEFVD